AAQPQEQLQRQRLTGGRVEVGRRGGAGGEQLAGGPGGGPGAGGGGDHVARPGPPPPPRAAREHLLAPPGGRGGGGGGRTGAPARVGRGAGDRLRGGRGGRGGGGGGGRGPAAEPGHAGHPAALELIERPPDARGAVEFDPDAEVHLDGGERAGPRADQRDVR